MNTLIERLGIEGLGITYWANVARNFTAKAASVKDWRIRCKADREMKTYAIELSKGKGYIIASSMELSVLYPGHVIRPSSDPKRYLWAIHFDGNHYSFMPIR